MIDEDQNGRNRVTFTRFLVDRYRGLRIVIHSREHTPPHFHVEADGINASFWWRSN